MRSAAGPGPRVVVTGLGCVTPLGENVEATWEAAAAGRSGVRAITRFDAEAYPCRIAATVETRLEPAIVPPKELRRIDRAMLLAVEAASEALADSGLDLDAEDRERIGVSIGTGIGGIATITEANETLMTRGPRRVSPFGIPMAISNMPSGLVSLYYRLLGPNLCHVSACATGAHAIGEAARIIERGDADVMVTGGTEAPILPFGLAGFGAMKALSGRNDAPAEASRPFDLGRDGFVMGEGAGVLVLESEPHARARGATVLAEVAGYAATADAYHVAAPDPEGAGAARCMRLAIEDAGLSPQDVGYVNAHATSTPAGDPTEVVALRKVFGAHIDQLAVSATKSMTGHLLGAAGAVEAILTIRALQTGVLPPTINLDDPDPECELDHVANKARPARIHAALSNSFGFGGTNASLLLARETQ